MSAEQIVFALVAVLILAAAFFTVTSRRMIHAALWLIVALFGVAILFGLLEASFFVVAQVLVYIGAIAILVLFAIMLTRRAMQDTGPQTNRGWIWAALGSLGLFGGMTAALLSWPAVQTPLQPLPANAVTILQLGQAFVSLDGYVLPFEVASVLLLAALIGSIYIAIERKGLEKPGQGGK